MSTFRAKMFIPCVQNRCTTVRADGKPRHSRMTLHPFHERPFYRCERQGGATPCEFATRPLYVANIDVQRWVRGAHKPDPLKLRDGDEPSTRDMETMI